MPMKRDREWLKRVRMTVKDVLNATEKHFEVVCEEDNPRLQDVIDGMDISIQKLRCLLKDELAMPRTPKTAPADKAAGIEAKGGR
jgi:hypothetical protein